jgi:hypothetical protein
VCIGNESLVFVVGCNGELSYLVVNLLHQFVSGLLFDFLEILRFSLRSTSSFLSRQSTILSLCNFMFIEESHHHSNMQFDLKGQSKKR